MTVILWAFTAFHFVVALASLGLAVRLLSAEERAHWRSQAARMVAEVMCWVYPAAAFFAVRAAWEAYNQGHHLAMPLLLAPIGWLMAMGLVFAIVDYAEDGVLGNARSRES
jgi:hypothetical protein